MHRFEFEHTRTTNTPGRRRFLKTLGIGAAGIAAWWNVVDWPAVARRYE